MLDQRNRRAPVGGNFLNTQDTMVGVGVQPPGRGEQIQQVGMPLSFQADYDAPLLSISAVVPSPPYVDSIDSVLYGTPHYFRALQGAVFVVKPFRRQG